MLTLSSGAITVAVRKSARARSYRLAINTRGYPVLTVPRAGRWKEARIFLEKHGGWLETRLARRPQPRPFRDGAVVPLRGIDHRIVSRPGLRGRTEVGEGPQGVEIVVYGGPDHLTRRLTDYLKAQARADLDLACARHAHTLGVRIAGLSVRDQATRWGSCSSRRTLNFNWRLILAPPGVLDYVSAHEVAHILEMNHSPAFWATVRKALPDYVQAKRWLDANGQGLMQFGAEGPVAPAPSVG